MLIIVNPYATTVSDRLRNLVVYALQGRFDVEAVATEAQNHATEIGREARDGGYDVVVAFGGDGTLNEVANGLAGTDLPVAILPGGSTNVVCRTLGIPNDVVDATEHLLSLPTTGSRARSTSARSTSRHFVFACGVGLDATVVRRVDENPKLKARVGPYYYSWAGISGFYRKYLPKRGADAGRGRRRRAGRGGHRDRPELRPAHLLRQQTDPGREGIAIDDGTLSLAVLKRATQRDMPSLISRPAQREANPPPDHRQVAHFDDVHEATVTSVSKDKDGALRPFPLQVDGDYIGDRTTGRAAAPSRAR